MGAALLLGVLGACENIALMPRPLLEHYVVNFTTGTQVTSRGRSLTVADLRPGDRVRVELREGTGRRLFADEIRLEGAGVASPMRTVEGTVERVVPERAFLELRTINGSLLTVYLPEGSSAETRSRFERIRVGDTVRLEGERLDDNRLELLAFR